MMKSKLYILLCISLLGFACKRDKNQQPLAEVNGTYLYPSDLKGVVPQHTQAKDSAMLTKTFIESWVRKQLLIQRAELNLTDEEKDVSKLIDEYRSSLLIFRYEQGLIRKQLDTIVKNEDIQQYYNDHPNNFILDQSIVKVLHIVVPLNAPERKEMMKWFYSNSTEDNNQLERYCLQYAKLYTYYNDTWVPFRSVLEQLPHNIQSPEEYLKNNSSIEITDSLYQYLVSIREYRIKGSTAPIEYVKGNIKDIILNKRKITFITELENTIYNDASDHNQFKIYSK